MGQSIEQGPPRQPAGKVNSDRAETEEALERQRVLGDDLRQLFQDITEEPLPKEFEDLLAKMQDEGGGE